MIRASLIRMCLLRAALVFVLRTVGLGVLALAAMSGLLVSQQADHGGVASIPVVTFFSAK
jgi:hypothetical protein